jgi:hypothetical protein
MVQALDSGGAYVPKDLLKDPSTANVAANSAGDKDVFTFVAPNLKTNSVYQFQFKYVFADGVESDEWSPTYTVFTSNIATLAKPKLTSANVTYFQGILNVTWDGTDYNNTGYGNGFSRILIYVRDNTETPLRFKIVGELTKPGTFSIALPPKSHTVKITAISVNGEQSDYSDEFTITPALTPPVVVTNATPAWDGTNFTVTFTHDPSSSANQYLKEYLITLNTATSGSKIFSLLPVSGTTQKFSLSLAENQARFGTAEKAFSGKIETLDIYGNKGSPVTFANTAYVSALTIPTLTVSAITNGYSVSYPNQTSNTFQFISVEEVVSSSSTDPGTGYAGVATGTSNPLVVPTVNTNKRWVRARLFDTVNESTGYSTAVAVTPLSPVTVDNDGPPNVSSVNTSGGLDSTGVIGFNGYADISWSAVTTGGIRGYRIRYRPITTPASSYSYADSPGSGTSYRLTGLGAGLVYEIAVATYDEYNNTSTSYVSGSNVTVGETPYIASTVDVTGYFSAKANPTDAANTAFKFGYGVDTGKRGLVFNTNNYWYIDSDQTALLKVGGSTTNYIEWNGSSFVIDGDLRAKKGSFSGNVSIASGASIYSGTLTGNTVTSTGDTGGSLSGAGYILNSSGLTFSSSTVSGITTIDATTGKLTTQEANIGGWLVNPSTNVGTLYKTTGTNTVKLDSAGYITVSGTGYQTGIGYPASSGSDANIVIWAGADKASAPFRVYKDGSVYLGSIVAGGATDSYATTAALSLKADTSTVNSQLSGKASTDLSNVGSSTVESKVTIITGGKVQTGTIASTGYIFNSGTGYATTGMSINLDNGSIISKQFKIDSNGTASFKGSLDVGIEINAPVISGGRIQIGDLGSGTWNFEVTSAGALIAKSATITGNIVGGTFSLANYQPTNFWTGTEFRAGSSNTYMGVNASNGTITLYSNPAQIELNEGSSNDSGTASTTYTNTAAAQQAIIDSTSIRIQGIPGIRNGLTWLGRVYDSDPSNPSGMGTGLEYNYAATPGAASEEITRYWSDPTAEYNIFGQYIGTRGNNSNRLTFGTNASPTLTYGKAARYRMIVADPYDNNQLKRGLGIYYGTRTSAPGASTGFVGDLWVSW